MFEINRTKQEPMVVIRAATGNELSNYEKNKLANIEANAQENVIETILINGQRVEPSNKEVNIELGELAFKKEVMCSDISSEDTFFITCELEDTAFNTQD